MNINKIIILIALLVLPLALSSCATIFNPVRQEPITADPFYVAMFATHDKVHIGRRIMDIDFIREYKESYIGKPLMVHHGNSETYGKQSFGMVTFAAIGFDPKTETECLILICHVTDNLARRWIKTGAYSAVSISFRTYYFVSDDNICVPTVLTFDEISLVHFPADPDARIINWGVSEFFLKQELLTYLDTTDVRCPAYELIPIKNM
jgi:hypothetical protein